MIFNGIERCEVLQLAENKEIELSLAQLLIKKSVYWYEHHSGPVKAPKHSKHIYSLYEQYTIEKTRTKRNDWSINFGSNTFYISNAVSRCQSTLIEFLDGAEQGNSEGIEKIKEALCTNVRQSVGNQRGDEYNLYPTNYQNHMIFGATSISVNEFIECILLECKIFKKPQLSEICYVCGKKFGNKRELNYHQQATHFRR